jgi:hypothetical protein
MSRNLHCNCLCHGSDGNAIGDSYFACKNCYAANHMGALPRQPHEQPHKPKAGGKKGPRKPKAEDIKAAKNLVDHAIDGLIKTAAKKIMSNLADAAEEAKIAMTVEPIEKPSGRKGVKISIG